MNQFLNINYREVLLTILLLICVSFSDVSGNSFSKDSIVESAPEKFNYFITGINYGSNAPFFGRAYGRKNPFVSADLIFKSKPGIWMSASAFNYFNETKLKELDLSAGWDFKLFVFDATVSYAKYFFSTDMGLVKATTTNLADAYLSLDWNILYSTLGGGFIFGNNSDFFLALGNSRYFQIDSLAKRANYLSFEPKMVLVAGTQTFSSTYQETNFYTYDYSTYSGTTTTNQPKGTGSLPPGTSPSGITSETTSSSKSFNILNIEFAIPVTYNYKKVSFEVNPRYCIPLNLIEGDPSKPVFIINAGIYFTFKN